jgi:hypothetical protein
MRCAVGAAPGMPDFAEKIRQTATVHIEPRAGTRLAEPGGPTYEPAELWSATGSIFAILDSKTAALLTHVSLMIAAISVAISAAENHFVTKICSAAFITLYILAAYCCLRCLRFEIFGWNRLGNRMSGKAATPAEQAAARNHETFILAEIAFRDSLYRTALLWASVLTVLSPFLFVVYFIEHSQIMGRPG